MNQKASKKILLVEDNADYSQLLERVLTKAGYEVKILANPTGVSAQISADKPDLIILDVMLPQISGLTILEELKKHERTEKIPVFCLTNLPEEVGREKALALGAYCYLTKAHYNVYDIVKHVDFYFHEELSDEGKEH